MKIKLTRREKEIFNLLLDGSVPKEIAAKLNISYETVISHQKSLYRKLNIHSVEELSEKYKDKREVINSSEFYIHQNSSQSLKLKILIPAVIIVLLLTAVFIIRLNSSKIEETETLFTMKIFDNVSLFAHRFGSLENNFYGEQYFTNQQLILSDIFSGTFEDLMQNSELLRLRISGTIDKECKILNADISYVFQGNWIGVAHSEGIRFGIGPGDFSEIFLLRRYNFDTLPEGGHFVLNLYYPMFTVNQDWVEDTGDRIPGDIPSGTIWATINNLLIEPVDTP